VGSASSFVFNGSGLREEPELTAAKGAVKISKIAPNGYRAVTMPLSSTSLFNSQK
jgi:hypothetical protein